MTQSPPTSFLLSLKDQSVLLFDTILREDWSESSMVTEHPVAYERPVNDHIQPQSNKVTVTAVVSTTPLSRQIPVVASINALAAADSGNDRPRLARDWLRGHRDEVFTLFSVRTGITNLLALREMTYSIDNFARLVFVLGFTQIRRAEVQRIKLPPEVRRKPKTKPPEAKGEASTGAVKVQGASVFAGLTDAINGRAPSGAQAQELSALTGPLTKGAKKQWDGEQLVSTGTAGEFTDSAGDLVIITEE